MSFSHERWLLGGSANLKYILPYSRGTRHYHGMELASAEFCMMIATMSRTLPGLREEKMAVSSVME